VSIKCKNITDGAVLHLSSQPALHTVVLIDCPFVSREGLELLMSKRRHTLRELNIGNCGALKPQLAKRMFESMTVLETLVLDGEYVTDEMLECVSSSRTITTFMCLEADFVTLAVCKSLARISTLRTLVFGDCRYIRATSDCRTAVTEHMKYSQSIQSITVYDADVRQRESHVHLKVTTADCNRTFDYFEKAYGLEKRCSSYRFVQDRLDGCESEKVPDDDRWESEDESVDGDAEQ
jgi:hypothetical protein